MATTRWTQGHSDPSRDVCGTYTGENGCGSKSDPRKCSQRPKMLKAQAKADALAKRLNEQLGPGWVGHAWCNLGEHWEATFGKPDLRNICRVSPLDGGRYYEADLRIQDPETGFVNQWGPKHKKPEMAVRLVVEQACAKAERLAEEAKAAASHLLGVR